MEANIRRISIVVDNDVDSESGSSKNIESVNDPKTESSNTYFQSFECDCDEEDRFQLLDTIATYATSAVSIDMVIFAFSWFKDHIILTNVDLCTE